MKTVSLCKIFSGFENVSDNWAIADNYADTYAEINGSYVSDYIIPDGFSLRRSMADEGELQFYQADKHWALTINRAGAPVLVDGSREILLDKAERYTVYDPQDSSIVYGRNLSPVEVLHEVLSYDSQLYQVRSDENEKWTSWSRKHWSRSDWQPTVLTTTAKDKYEAFEKIAKDAIKRPTRLSGPEWMPDEDFRKMESQEND